jgi:hypothetical protein
VTLVVDRACVLFPQLAPGEAGCHRDDCPRCFALGMRRVLRLVLEDESVVAAMSPELFALVRVFAKPEAKGS